MYALPCPCILLLVLMILVLIIAQLGTFLSCHQFVFLCFSSTCIFKPPPLENRIIFIKHQCNFIYFSKNGQWLSIAQITNHMSGYGRVPVLFWTICNFIAVLYSLLQPYWPNHSSSNTPWHLSIVNSYLECLLFSSLLKNSCSSFKNNLI